MSESENICCGMSGSNFPNLSILRIAAASSHTSHELCKRNTHSGRAGSAGWMDSFAESKPSEEEEEEEVEVEVEVESWGSLGSWDETFVTENAGLKREGGSRAQIEPDGVTRTASHRALWVFRCSLQVVGP